LLAVGADLATITRALPKKEISNRETAIHGIKKIADFLGGPNKRPLQIGQTNLATINVFDKQLY
jgi:hypothetical protein